MRYRKSTKKQVTWSAPGDKASHPRRHAHEADVPADLAQQLAINLHVGALFVTTVAMIVMKLAPDERPPPFPVLQNVGRLKGHDVVPEGTICVYTGEVRTEEEGKMGRFRLIRHVFLVKDGRYIVPNMNCVRPL